MHCHDCERQLDAYVDGELTPSESLLLHEHFEACAACSRRLAERETLSRLVRLVPYHSAPAGLRAKVAATRKRSSWARTGVLAWAAVLVLAATLGGTMVVFTRARAEAKMTTAIAEDVVADHVRALTAQHLFDVHSTDQHTVKPWFLGKLDFSPPVSDLASVGFPLVGGRIDHVAGKLVAALVYQRRQHPITVFVWPAASQDAAIVPRSIRGFQIEHWVHDGMTFWAVSDLNQAELTEFARGLGR